MIPGDGPEGLNYVIILKKRDAIDISTCELEGSLFTWYLRYTVDQEPVSTHFLFSDRNLQKVWATLTISFT
jgi:hypothetical protein